LSYQKKQKSQVSIVEVRAREMKEVWFVVWKFSFFWKRWESFWGRKPLVQPQKHLFPKMNQPPKADDQIPSHPGFPVCL
jgi:hypothetical protein